MAHHLDMSNDRVNFAHAREKAWHGLGNLMTPGASIDEWTLAAGMNWSASMDQVFVKRGDDFIAIPDRFALTRSDTGAELGSFTGRYRPVQPADIMSFFRDFLLTDDRFEMETAGCLKGGAIVWALARFRNDLNVLGERHVPYVMLTTSFDGTRATTAQATMIRVVCNNTLTASIFDKQSASVRVSHMVKWSPEVAAKAHTDLEAVAQSFGAYREMAEAMAKVRMTRDKTREFLSRLICKETAEEEQSSRMRNQVAALLNAYDETLAEGTAANTGWAAFNAVTRYADHERSTRSSTGDTVQNARMASAFYGTGAQLKAAAAKMLLDYDRQPAAPAPNSLIAA